VHSHVADDYDCQLCRGIRGDSGSPTLVHDGDVVARTELVVAAICPYFRGENRGHVIVVPTEHYENLYVMPAPYLHACVDMAQAVALAMKKAYAAAGITLRQNNEPAGGQTAFHFHLHVFPRYPDDGFDDNPPEYAAEPAERARWAQRLKRLELL
jgi:histidine triad (HIT) family protein